MGIFAAVVSWSVFYERLKFLYRTWDLLLPVSSQICHRKSPSLLFSTVSMLYSLKVKFTYGLWLIFLLYLGFLIPLPPLLPLIWMLLLPIAFVKVCVDAHLGDVNGISASFNVSVHPAKLLAMPAARIPGQSQLCGSRGAVCRWMSVKH